MSLRSASPVSQSAIPNFIADMLPSDVAHNLSVVLIGLVKYVGGRRNASLLATAAFAGILATRVYRNLVQVPPHLQSLPRIPFAFTIKRMFQKIPFVDQVKTDFQIVCKDAFERGLVGSVDECPKMWTEWRFGTWQVVLANPLDLADFYNNHVKFEKPRHTLPMYTFDKYFGSSVGTVKTPQWKQQRKVMNPAFRRGWATSLFSEPVMNLMLKLDELEASQKLVDVSLWMRRVTLDAMSSVILGVNLDCVNHPDSELIQTYDRLIDYIFDPVSNVFGGNLLRYSKGMRQFNHDLDDFNNFVYEWIDKITLHLSNQKDDVSEPDGNDEKNLLEMMVSAQLKTPDVFSREDLRSNCVSLFLAGHDTTATSLTIAIYLLGMNPRVQEKARMEVMKVMGNDANATENRTLASNKQQSSMRYLTCVIKESLRLYSVPVSLPRELTSDHTFASTGLHVPKGTTVSAHAWNIHHRNEYWDNSANEFIPERWETLSPDAESIPLHPSAHNFRWTPFGGGQRICAGQQFSIVEQRVILSALLQQYSWKVVGNDDALGGTPSSHHNAAIFQDIFVELTSLSK